MNKLEQALVDFHRARGMHKLEEALGNAPCVTDLPLQV